MASPSDRPTINIIDCNHVAYDIADTKVRERVTAIENTGVNNIKDMAFEEKKDWTSQDDLANAITILQSNFQAGVDAVYDACDAKGSTPASHSLSDVVTAIGDIQTGGNYGTLEVNEDGDYYPSQGIDAQNYVKVSKDVGQPHTVVFYGPDGNIIKTQVNVPYHGYANCTLLDGTLNNGLYFKGWNPSPTDIVRDTSCYPVYGDYVVEPGEISDTWETICANKGADYPLGSNKILMVTIPPYSFNFDFNAQDGSEWVNKTSQTYNVGSVNVAVQMVKVAEGEDNSHSTWVSDGITYFNNELLEANKATGMFGINATDSNSYSSDQTGSAIRKYLNTHFLENLPVMLAIALRATLILCSFVSVAVISLYLFSSVSLIL